MGWTSWCYDGAPDRGVGRFCQNEPLLPLRPYSHYLYANQNPMTFVDPMGLAPCGGAEQKLGTELCQVTPQKDFQSQPSGMSESLRRRLTAQEEQLHGPASVGKYSKDYWLERAKALVSWEALRNNPIALNKKINEAYLHAYRLDPSTYKFPGLAYQASVKVGEGLSQALSMSTVAHTYDFAKQGAFLLSGKPKDSFFFNQQLPLHENVLQVHAPGSVYEDLALGNAAIFLDMYWANLAYHEGGIEELRRILEAGEMRQEFFDAWELVDAAKKSGSCSMLWLGAKKLIEFEQGVVLQGVFDRDQGSQRHKWKALSIQVPIPDTLGKYGAKKFSEIVPGGDYSNWGDRRKWVIDYILPNWEVNEAKIGLR